MILIVSVEFDPLAQVCDLCSLILNVCNIHSARATLRLPH